MRRSLATMLAVSIMGVMVPAAAQPGAALIGGQEASAWWIEMDGATGQTWMVDAMRFVTETGPITIGFVGRGKCRKTRADEWVIITCSARGRVKELGLDEFQMDPALRSASMDVKVGKHRHSIDWAARGAPGVGESAYAGEWGAYGGATAGTDATADARLFGKRLSRGCALCYLAEGAGAAAWAGVADRDVVIERHGDTFVAHLTLRSAL
jgi:hypothetical protein